MKKNKFFGVIESFSRYEFKYILSKNKADKIIEEISKKLLTNTVIENFTINHK